MAPADIAVYAAEKMNHPLRMKKQLTQIPSPWYNKRMGQNLKYYEDRAKTMTAAELHYALLDVMKTIDVLESDDATRNNPTPYLQRLYLEKDAYSVEKYNRKY